MRKVFTSLGTWAARHGPFDRGAAPFVHFLYFSQPKHEDLLGVGAEAFLSLRLLLREGLVDGLLVPQAPDAFEAARDQRFAVDGPFC